MPWPGLIEHINTGSKQTTVSLAKKNKTHPMQCHAVTPIHVDLCRL